MTTQEQETVRERILVLAADHHQAEIVRRTGSTRQYVYRVLAEAGVSAAPRPSKFTERLLAKRQATCPRRGKPFDQVRINRIRALAESGLSKAEVAKQLGVSSSAVAQMALRHLPDVVFRDARRTASVDKIKALAEQGYSKAEIGRRIGVSGTAVSLCAARCLPDVVFHVVPRGKQRTDAERPAEVRT